jgi:catechol 2,3-dioxygenase-like lactoylglutathione lyase family enzyme
VEITKVDFVGIPTQDMERATRFYVDTLGLRQDEQRDTEFWAGETCFSLWKPEWAGHAWEPSRTGLIALHVADVAAARAGLEQKGVDFEGDTVDTGVCHMAFFSDPDGNSLMLHHNYERSADGQS